MPDVFPTTPEYTNFDGPNENPLSDGGRWIQGFFGYPLHREGNIAKVTTEGVLNGMVWVANIFPSPCEVWACTNGGQLGAALETWRVGMFLSTPYDQIGYQSYYGGALNKAFVIRRYDGVGSWTELISFQTLAYPERIGMRITTTHIEQWARYSGVWTFIHQAADTNHRGPFLASIAMEIQGGVDQLWMGCFGAGMKNRQHIYRWLNAKPGVLPA